MNQDVFKFPDGNGGFILKIQGPDKEWHICDEHGNILEETSEESDEESLRQASRPVKKAKKVKSVKHVALTVSVPSDFFELLGEYTRWKSYSEHIKISRSEIIVKAISGIIKRDSEFQTSHKTSKK